MNREHRIPVVDDESDVEVEAFALGELWTAFTMGIEVGRNKEILNERADSWTEQYNRNATGSRPK